MDLTLHRDLVMIWWKNSNTERAEPLTSLHCSKNKFWLVYLRCEPKPSIQLRWNFGEMWFCNESDRNNLWKKTWPTIYLNLNSSNALHTFICNWKAFSYCLAECRPLLKSIPWTAIIIIKMYKPEFSGVLIVYLLHIGLNSCSEMRFSCCSKLTYNALRTSVVIYLRETCTQ